VSLLFGASCFESRFDNEVSLNLTPHYPLFVGDTIQVVATAKFAVSGSDPEFRYPSDKFPDKYNWNSSNPFAATVDSRGVVRGIAEGTTNLSATFEGVTATFALRVIPAVASLELSPASATIKALDTVSFQITPLDAQQRTTSLVPVQVLEGGSVAMIPFQARVEAPTRLVYRGFSAGQHQVMVWLHNVRSDRVRSAKFTLTVNP
jgi:hypothetical protein